MNVLIEFEKTPVAFRKPRAVISCADPALLGRCFEEMERALAAGYYLAGFLSYEAGYHFEERLRENRAYDFPLLHMGVYAAPAGGGPGRGAARAAVLDRLRLNIAPETYASHIRAIRGYIAQGEVYQITYCIKVRFSFRGDPFSLYRLLLKEQPVPYPAYIETDRFHILSLSPEMFIKKEAHRVKTKPMKGTWPRGQTRASDALARRMFQVDEKNRAENLMIADLLRNDLGRVGDSVRAPRLFEVARYRTLYQMTSTITGRVAKDVGLYDLFASVFPSGSVTGAPKIRAMQVIRTLETEPRRIYTGAIGYITPERDLFFNVPIRTLLLRRQGGEMGIGGGIVWDSTPRGEWEEGRLKAKFLIDASQTSPAFYPAMSPPGLPATRMT